MMPCVPAMWALMQQLLLTADQGKRYYACGFGCSQFIVQELIPRVKKLTGEPLHHYNSVHVLRVLYQNARTVCENILTEPRDRPGWVRDLHLQLPWHAGSYIMLNEATKLALRLAGCDEFAWFDDPDAEHHDGMQMGTRARYNWFTDSETDDDAKTAYLSLVLEGAAL